MRVFVMQRLALMLTVAVALAAGSTALSGEIYKWTDENGNVHYEDRPLGGEGTERVNIVSRSTDNAAVKASIDARRARVAAREEEKANQAAAAADTAKAAEDAEDREQKCSEYRSRMESYLQSQRLYREDANGERTYLDESQIQEARAKVQEKITEYCN